jgi:hypothetical protein
LALPDEQGLARSQQVVFVMALGVAGVLAGQVVRQARRLLQGHAVAIEEAQEK